MKLREKILNAKDFRSETFTSERWDITAEVRSITQGERIQLLKDTKDEAGEMDNAKFGPAIIIATFRDPESGDLIFSKTDRDALLEKDLDSFDEALSVALRVCGFAKNDKEQAAAEKN